MKSARGTSVKCTNCGLQFKVYPNHHSGGPERWVVRTAEGRELVFTSLRELQRGSRNIEGSHYLVGDIKGFADRYQRDGLLDAVVKFLPSPLDIDAIVGHSPKDEEEEIDLSFLDDAVVPGEPLQLDRAGGVGDVPGAQGAADGDRLQGPADRERDDRHAGRGAGAAAGAALRWTPSDAIHARLADPADGPSALRLAQLLHPTPAVGGRKSGAGCEPPHRPCVRECADDHAAAAVLQLGAPLLAPARTFVAGHQQREQSQEDAHGRPQVVLRFGNNWFTARNRASASFSCSRPGFVSS